MFLFTRRFWSYAGERAAKTVAQTAIAGLTVTGVTGILDVAWVAVASTSALAGLVSILTSTISYDPNSGQQLRELNADYQAALARAGKLPTDTL